MKISISEFQSFSKVELDIQGFTVLTGKSNLGKSALIRAVKAALFGASGTYYVRNSARVKFTSVSLTFADGDYVFWKKVINKSPGLETSLEVNGNLYTKLGRKHHTLVKDLGILEIETQSCTFTPQIASQFDGPFLLNVPDTAVAEVFKVLGRGDIVSRAKDNSSKDLRELKDLLKVRESDLSKLELSLSSYAWVPEMESHLSSLLSSKSSLDLIESQITLVSDILSAPLLIIPPLPSPLDPLLVSSYQRVKDILSTPLISIPPLPLPYNMDLVDTYTQVHTLISDLSLSSISLRDTLSELTDAQSSKSLLETKLGVCPLCGNSFT